MSTSSNLEQTSLTSAFSRKRKNNSFVTDHADERDSAHASGITGMIVVDEACNYKDRTFHDQMFGNDIKPVDNLCMPNSFLQANPNAGTREHERECKHVRNDSHEQDTDSSADKHDEGGPNDEKQDDNDNDYESSSKGNYLPSVRICLVCGDRASGYNFNVLSCESCKAFFRRNALKPNVSNCLFTGNCKIEMHTRRFCTACRLDKCLKVGMKRSMILNDDAKEKRRVTMLENRERRTKGTPKQLSSASSSPKPNNDSNYNQTAQSVLKDDVKVLATSPTPHIPIEEVKTKIEPLKCALSVNRPLLIRVGSVDPNSSFVCVARPDSSIPLSDFEEPPLTEKEALDKISNRRILTEEEWRFLSTLCDHYKEAFVSAAHSNDLPHPNTTLNALVNLTGLMVRKIIRFAKRVTDFQALRQSAQIALLKGSVVDTLYLHSAFHYDPNDECWDTPHGRVRTDILKQALAQESLSSSCDMALSRTIYEEHCLFARSLRPLLDDDWNIVTLLQLITLFSSHRPAIAHNHLPRAELGTASSQPQSETQVVLIGSQDQTQIANIQDKFLVLLKHYLESKYSVVHSRTLLVRIMQKVDELHQLTEMHGRVLLFADPNQIEPLMLEVFDWLVAR